LAGARACPPEDCGGPWGYQRMLEILSELGHEEYVETVEWLGGEFDPQLEVAAGKSLGGLWLAGARCQVVR